MVIWAQEGNTEMGKIDLMKAVILHVPHSSRLIPDDCREEILITDAELNLELLRMTDAYTDLIVTCFEDVRSLVFPVSRLVVDVERFRDDKEEAMAKISMGSVYSRTHNGRLLRRIIPVRRKELLKRFYDPHHGKFAGLVGKCLQVLGRCLILDIHSFPSRPLPYEMDQNTDRPDICLGSDPFHTSGELLTRAGTLFKGAFESVKVNFPFSGAIVPLPYYNKDRRVSSLMIEINRRLLMDEDTGKKIKQCVIVFHKIGEIVEEIIGSLAPI